MPLCNLTLKSYQQDKQLLKAQQQQDKPLQKAQQQQVKPLQKAQQQEVKPLQKPQLQSAKMLHHPVMLAGVVLSFIIRDCADVPVVFVVPLLLRLSLRPLSRTPRPLPLLPSPLPLLLKQRLVVLMCMIIAKKLSGTTTSAKLIKFTGTYSAGRPAVLVPDQLVSTWSTFTILFEYPTKI